MALKHLEAKRHIAGLHLADKTQDPVEPTSFWVNPFGVAWPLLKASDLILVNPEGKVVEGGPVRLLNAAGMIAISPINPNPSRNKMLTPFPQHT